MTDRIRKRAAGYTRTGLQRSRSGLPEGFADSFVALRVAGLLQKREPLVQLFLAQRRIFLNKNQAVFGFAQLLGFDQQLLVELFTGTKAGFYDFNALHAGEADHALSEV